MTTVTITKINKTERTSKKTGKPFTSLGIMTVEHGEKWLSSFDGKETAAWKEGDKVDIEITQNGEYLNFTVPKKEDKADQKLEKILNKLTGIGVDLEIIKGYVIPKTTRVVSDNAYPQESSGTAFDEPTEEELNAALA